MKCKSCNCDLPYYADKNRILCEQCRIRCGLVNEAAFRDPCAPSTPPPPFSIDCMPPLIEGPAPAPTAGPAIAHSDTVVRRPRPHRRIQVLEPYPQSRLPLCKQCHILEVDHTEKTICATCSQSLASQMAMRLPPVIAMEPSRTELIHCTMCFETQSSSSAISGGLCVRCRQTHPTILKDLKPKQKKITCIICEKSFKTKEAFKTHFTQGCNNFYRMCHYPDCIMIFPSRNEIGMKAHLEQHRLG